MWRWTLDGGSQWIRYFGKEFAIGENLINRRAAHRALSEMFFSRSIARWRTITRSERYIEL